MNQKPSPYFEHYLVNLQETRSNEAPAPPGLAGLAQAGPGPAGLGGAGRGWAGRRPLTVKAKVKEKRRMNVVFFFVREEFEICEI